MDLQEFEPVFESTPIDFDGAVRDSSAFKGQITLKSALANQLQGKGAGKINRLETLTSLK